MDGLDSTAPLPSTRPSYGLNTKACVDVIVGGQYGSEGKGQIAAFIAPEYDYLMRVGGPNAGHTVHEQPVPYTFHQLPSGTRSSDAKLIIGPGALINLEVLFREIIDCSVHGGRLYIDPQAMIIEISDLRVEAKLRARISSTAQGVGAAAARRISDRWPGSSVRLARDIPALNRFLRPTLDVLSQAYEDGSSILLEGTQGTSLSLLHGPYPHVTSRDTTVCGCLSEAGIPASAVRRVMMVCRTYPIRVCDPTNGTSGPLANEISFEELSKRCGIPLCELKEKEVTSTTKRPRRIAEFDWAQFKRATLLNMPSDVVITFVDYISIANRGKRYEELDSAAKTFIAAIEQAAKIPVTIVSTAFGPAGIIDRRPWKRHGNDSD
jgi:adenylosuccinate synthase